MIYAFFPSENPRITIQQKSLHIKAQKSIPNCAIRAYCTHPKFRGPTRNQKNYLAFFPQKIIVLGRKTFTVDKGKTTYA